VIGEVLLSGLVRDLGASRDIYIPRCLDGIRQKRNQAIVRDYLAGVPVNELALKYHLSDRQIWRILKETNMQDDRQESLF
jgi:Mor family transcriptional regulator